MVGLLQRTPRAIVTVAPVVLAIALVPVFAINALHTTDANFFLGWDRESQALVLATVQRARNGSAPVWGLEQASPDLFAPYSTFDRPSAIAQSYTHYPSQLGAQAHLFTTAYDLGAESVGALTDLEAVLFATVFVLFLVMLWITVSRSLATICLVAAVCSPWTVSAAHNLYWVPWTWLVPSIAASALLVTRTRLVRGALYIAIIGSTAFKAACGYEFITTVILMATGMPLLAAAVGRLTWVRALRTASLVSALALLGFLATLVIHAVFAGGGSFAAGINEIVMDATKRTYGAPRPGLDATTQLSLTVSPWTVLVRYVVEWQTDLFSIGIGTPLQLQSGRWGFPALVAAAVTCVVVTAVRRDERWRRLLAILVITAVPPMSWFILAKSHAFSDVAVCYVLWYLMLIPSLIWVIVASAVWFPPLELALRRVRRRVLSVTAA